MTDVRIEVLYKSQRYEVFSTDVQTSPEPYHKKGICILTEWILCLGAPEEQGVILEQHWYERDERVPSGVLTPDGASIPAGVRRVGCAMLLVSPEEVKNLVWLKKDGEKILWREGDDLINGERFFAMEQLCYSDESTRSINRRALAVFDYLRNISPDVADEDIAAAMGYTLPVIERVRDAELAQEDGFESEVEGYEARNS